MVSWSCLVRFLLGRFLLLEICPSVFENGVTSCCERAAIAKRKNNVVTSAPTPGRGHGCVCAGFCARIQFTIVERGM